MEIEEVLDEQDTPVETTDTEMYDNSDASTDHEEGMLTLAQIETLTSIPHVTLARYARQFSSRLPHTGSGKSRRYFPATVEVFQEIKQEAMSRRGRPPGPQTSTTVKRGGAKRAGRKSANGRRRTKTAEEAGYVPKPVRGRRGRRHNRPIDQQVAAGRRPVPSPTEPRSIITAHELAFRHADLEARLSAVKRVIMLIEDERNEIESEIAKLG